MTIDEIEEAIENLREEGMDDDALIGAVYMLFKEDKLNAEELRIVLNVMGYDLTEEFMNLPEEQQKDSDFVDFDEENELEEFKESK